MLNETAGVEGQAAPRQGEPADLTAEQIDGLSRSIETQRDWIQQGQNRDCQREAARMSRILAALSMARRTAAAEDKLAAAEAERDEQRDMAEDLAAELDSAMRQVTALTAKVDRLTAENAHLQKRVDLWEPKIRVAGSWPGGMTPIVGAAGDRETNDRRTAL